MKWSVGPSLKSKYTNGDNGCLFPAKMWRNVYVADICSISICLNNINNVIRRITSGWQVDNEAFGSSTFQPLFPSVSCLSEYDDCALNIIIHVGGTHSSSGKYVPFINCPLYEWVHSDIIIICILVSLLLLHILYSLYISQLQKNCFHNHSICMNFDLISLLFNVVKPRF